MEAKDQAVSPRKADSILQTTTDVLLQVEDLNASTDKELQLNQKENTFQLPIDELRSIEEVPKIQTPFEAVVHRLRDHKVVVMKTIQTTLTRKSYSMPPKIRRRSSGFKRELKHHMRKGMGTSKLSLNEMRTCPRKDSDSFNSFLSTDTSFYQKKRNTNDSSQMNPSSRPLFDSTDSKTEKKISTCTHDPPRNEKSNPLHVSSAPFEPSPALPKAHSTRRLKSPRSVQNVFMPCHLHDSKHANAVGKNGHTEKKLKQDPAGYKKARAGMRRLSLPATRVASDKSCSSNTQQLGQSRSEKKNAMPKGMDESKAAVEACCIIESTDDVQRLQPSSRRDSQGDVANDANPTNKNISQRLRLATVKAEAVSNWSKKRRSIFAHAQDTQSQQSQQTCPSDPLMTPLTKWLSDLTNSTDRPASNSLFGFNTRKLWEQLAGPNAQAPSQVQLAKIIATAAAGNRTESLLMLYSAMHQTNDGKIPIRTLKQALDKFEAAGGDPIVLQKATDYLRSMPEEGSVSVSVLRSMFKDHPELADALFPEMAGKQDSEVQDMVIHLAQLASGETSALSLEHMKENFTWGLTSILASHMLVCISAFFFAMSFERSLENFFAQSVSMALTGLLLSALAFLLYRYALYYFAGKAEAKAAAQLNAPAHQKILEAVVDSVPLHLHRTNDTSTKETVPQTLVQMKGHLWVLKEEPDVWCKGYGTMENNLLHFVSDDSIEKTTHDFVLDDAMVTPNLQLDRSPTPWAFELQCYDGKSKRFCAYNERECQQWVLVLSAKQRKENASELRSPNMLSKPMNLSDQENSNRGEKSAIFPMMFRDLKSSKWGTAITRAVKEKVDAKSIVSPAKGNIDEVDSKAAGDSSAALETTALSSKENMLVKARSLEDLGHDIHETQQILRLQLKEFVDTHGGLMNPIMGDLLKNVLGLSSNVDESPTSMGIAGLLEQLLIAQTGASTSNHVFDALKQSEKLQKIRSLSTQALPRNIMASAQEMHKIMSRKTWATPTDSSDTPNNTLFMSNKSNPTAPKEDAETNINPIVAPIL